MAESVPSLFLFKQIHDALEKSVNNDMREMGLTFSQASVLRTLSNDSGCQMSMKELEKALHVAQSTTVRIVQNMERNGLVDSFGDVSDKRVKYIRLTEKGKTLNKVAQQEKRCRRSRHVFRFQCGRKTDVSFHAGTHKK